MRPRKLALLLIVLGLVCLPAPLYLGWTAQALAPAPQTSQIYYAQPVDPANASDRDWILQVHDTDVALSIHQVSQQYSAGEYRAPNETHRTLETAIETGEASTTDAAAQADLRAIARNETFVHDAYDDRDQYYRLQVTDNGATVRASPVSRATVANATVEQAAVHYTNLTTGERETVDRIIENSSDDDGYRPRVNDPFVDQLPTLVYKDGTLYSLFVNGHVDDFGPGFTGFLAGLAVAAIGILLLLVGTSLNAYLWWREKQGE